MAKNIELGVRLTADGKGFVGAVTVSDKALRGFTAGGRKAAQSARDTARATRGLERQMRGLGQSASAAHGKIAGYAAGIVSINRLAASMRAVLDATVRQEQALAQVEARMRSTGGAAGLTTRQVADMAAALQDVTTFGDEKILETQSVLLTFRRIGRETFGGATEAVLDLATAMGQSAQSAAIQLGKALDDPKRGLDALTRSGLVLTDAQKELIRDLFAAGRAAEGQRIILDEVSVQMGGAARAARGTLGGALDALRNRFGDLLEVQEHNSRGLVDWINAMERALKLRPAELDELHRDIFRVAEAAGYLAAIIGVRLVVGALKFVKASVLTRTALIRTEAAAIRSSRGLLAVAAAGRTAGASLALLGGPLGVATLAAYAIWQLVEASQDHKDVLRGLPEDLDAYRESLERLSLDELDIQADHLRDAIAAQTERVEAARVKLVIERSDEVFEERPTGRPNRHGVATRTEVVAVKREVDQAAVRQAGANLAKEQRQLQDLALKLNENLKKRFGSAAGGTATDAATDAATDKARTYADLLRELADGETKLKFAHEDRIAAITASSATDAQKAELVSLANEHHKTALAAHREQQAEAARRLELETGLPALAAVTASVAELRATTDYSSQATELATAKARIRTEAEDRFKTAVEGTLDAYVAMRLEEERELRVRSEAADLLQRFAPSMDQFAERMEAANRLHAQGALSVGQYAAALAEMRIAAGEGGWLDGWMLQMEEMRLAAERTASDVGAQFAEVLGPGGTLQRGFADSAASALVFGTSFRQALGQVARQALASLISGIIQMGVQWLVTDRVLKASKAAGAVGYVAQVTGQSTAQALLAAQAAYASTAAIPVVGPALAPAAAGQALAVATGFGASAVTAATAAAGAMVAEHGAVLDRPTWFGARNVPLGVAGESGREGVLPLRRLPSGDLGVGTVGGGTRVVNVRPVITVQIHLDGGGGVAGVALAGEEAADRVAAAVRSVIADEQRPGGLLNRTDVA